MHIEREWLGGAETYDLTNPNDYTSFVKYVERAEELIRTFYASPDCIVIRNSDKPQQIERFICCDDEESEPTLAEIIEQIDAEWEGAATI